MFRYAAGPRDHSRFRRSPPRYGASSVGRGACALHQTAKRWNARQSRAAAGPWLQVRTCFASHPDTKNRTWWRQSEQDERRQTCTCRATTRRRIGLRASDDARDANGYLPRHDPLRSPPRAGRSCLGLGTTHSSPGYVPSADPAGGRLHRRRHHRFRGTAARRSDANRARTECRGRK